LWYHRHLLHKTGEQVYKGLAGLFYIDDDVSDSLNIPNDYGVNDIPLVIQDKKLTQMAGLNTDWECMTS
jgi:blue copper oxidase